MSDLEQTITALWDGRDDLDAVMPRAEAEAAVRTAIDLLDTGEARVAELTAARSSSTSGSSRRSCSCSGSPR